jgi:hypothetical protein
MNYDQVSHTIPDDLEDEELEATVVLPPHGLDWKHKALYTCLGVFLTAKLILVCWIFTLSFPSDALAHLFHW